MSLRETIKTKIQEEKEAADKQKEQEPQQQEKEAKLQEQIAAIDDRIEQINATQSELGVANQRLGSASQQLEGAQADVRTTVESTGIRSNTQELGTVKKGIQNLIKDPSFKDHLEQQGIRSPEDLIRNENYANEEEVIQARALEETRAGMKEEIGEAVSARQGAKREARRVLGDSEATPDLGHTEEVTGALAERKGAVAEQAYGLEDERGGLEAQRFDLHYQTAEGVAEIKEKMKKQIDKRLSNKMIEINSQFTKTLPQTSEGIGIDKVGKESSPQEEKARRESWLNQPKMLEYVKPRDIRDARKIGEEMVEQFHNEEFGPDYTTAQMKEYLFRDCQNRLDQAIASKGTTAGKEWENDRGRKLRLELPKKFEMDWTDAEAKEFEGREGQLITDKRQLDKRKEEVQPEAGKTALDMENLADLREQKVMVSKSGDINVPQLIIDRKAQIQEQLPALQEQQKALEADQNKLEETKTGWFGKEKKEAKKAEQIKQINTELEGIREEINKLNEEKNRLEQQEKSIASLSQRVKKLQRGKQFDKKMMTLGELGESLENSVNETMNQELSPEDQQKYNRYLQLQEAAGNAKKEYNDFKINSSRGMI